MDTLTLLNSLSLTLSGNKRAEPERMGAWVPQLDSGVVMVLIDYVGDLGQSYLTSLCLVSSSSKWGIGDIIVRR